MVKVASLMRLRALLVMKAKEGTVLLGETGWKQMGTGVPSLQWKRPALVKSKDPAPFLSFCFFEVLSRAGVPGGDTSALDFSTTVPTTLAVNVTAFAPFWMLGFASLPGGTRRNSIWKASFEDMILHSLEEAGNKLGDLGR
jgi:hypothetical protein